jgi:hypothetical protein
MSMRTTILSVMMILLLPFAAADIKISVVSYDADTNEAKILVANTGIEEYHDLTITFDETKPREYPGSIFKPGTAFIIPKIASEGFHMLTVKTGSGHVFSQELMFSPSGIERIKAAYPVRVSKQKIDTQRDMAGEEEGGRYWVLVLGILALAAVIFGILWLIPRMSAWMAARKARKAQQARPSQRPAARPYQQQSRRPPARRPVRPYRRARRKR